MRNRKLLCTRCRQVQVLKRLEKRVENLLYLAQDAGVSACFQARITARRCTCRSLQDDVLQVERKTRPCLRLMPWPKPEVTLNRQAPTDGAPQGGSDAR